MSASHRRLIKATFFMVSLLMVAALAGCSTQTKSSSSSSSSSEKTTTIKIGTLQTDDLLPLWVASAEGLDTKAGIKLDIITFQSAQEQIAAMTAGEIDGMMTDMIVPMQLIASGTPVKTLLVTQGAPAGIVAAKGSNITSLKQLAGVKTGASSATVIEYIYSRAMRDAGVVQSDIQIEEIKKLPVRYEMLNAGKIKAAGLPWTFYSLAVAQGAKPLVDQEAASKYTSTVLVMNSKTFGSQAGGGELAQLKSVWNAAVQKINNDPESYRSTLIEKASLPAPLQKSYEMRTYPQAAAPDRGQVEDAVSWMVEKGYLKQSIAYEDFIW